MSWQARQTKALLGKVRKAGFVCDERMRSGVDEILTRGNGKRRAALLRPHEVLQTMLDAAASRDEFAFRVADGKERTRTACLVVRTNYERWVVGVTTCAASKPTPAGCSGWGLEKWRESGDNRKLLQDAWGIKYDASRLGVSFEEKTFKRAKPTAEDRAHEAELLAQIIAAPDDDGPRLVFADWLADRDPQRSEFIVLQCQAFAMRPGPKRAELERRADEIRIAHGDKWLPPGCVSRSIMGPAVSYRRGFAFAVACDAKTLFEHAKALFATTPIEHVGLMPDEGELERFLALEQIDQLTTFELEFGEHLDTKRALDMLASSARLARLTSLTLVRAKFSAETAALLARPSTLPAVIFLRLRWCELSPELRAVIGKRPGIKFVRD